MSVRVRDVLLYVAGPYRAAHIRSVVANIRRAEGVALQLWQAGLPAICPHLNTALMDGPEGSELWLEGDLVMLRRCDAVVLCPGWERSAGTLAEVEEAKRLGIPVFHGPDEAIDRYTDDGA